MPPIGGSSLKLRNLNAMKQKTAFSFGKNWLDYVDNFLDDKKITIAKDSLLKYLPQVEYKDKTFIDVGCGSGIFSLSAFQLGCKKVISFDIDPYSVEATKAVRERFTSAPASNSAWNIFQGDILDGSLVDKLRNQGDVAYAWGVLHHTGDMKQAITNTAQLVKPNGYLILAIYNRAPSSDFWLKVKQFYNARSALIKEIMVSALFCYIISLRLLGNIKRKILKRKKRSLFTVERGMSVFYDVKDWLGGYPYEYASSEEIQGFVEKLGFILLAAPTKLPALPKTNRNRFTLVHTGNNEFVFRKTIQD